MFVEIATNYFLLSPQTSPLYPKSHRHENFPFKSKLQYPCRPQESVLQSAVFGDLFTLSKIIGFLFSNFANFFEIIKIICSPVQKFKTTDQKFPFLISSIVVSSGLFKVASFYCTSLARSVQLYNAQCVVD